MQKYLMVTNASYHSSLFIQQPKVFNGFFLKNIVIHGDEVVPLTEGGIYTCKWLYHTQQGCWNNVGIDAQIDIVEQGCSLEQYST